MDMGLHIHTKFEGKTDNEISRYFNVNGLHELGDDGCIAGQLLDCWRRGRYVKFLSFSSKNKLADFLIHQWDEENPIRIRTGLNEFLVEIQPKEDD